MLYPQWISDVLAAYSDDPIAQTLLSKLSIDLVAVPHFTLVDGILRHKNRIWLGTSPVLHQRVFTALHSSAIGGHSGAPATYHRIKQLFSSPSMKKDILLWVQSCTTCQQAKPDRSKYPGLLEPLPVPSSSWEIISMDFVEGLPVSGTANSILVVVDKFSKFAHFLPLRHPFTAHQVATVFMDSIYRLHGMPHSIISDRDRIFTSTLWKQLFKLSGTKLRMSTAYHPQTDGQTERVNQCLETYLRCFVHACPTHWRKWLSTAEFWYNTSLHSSLGRSPFKVLYGRPPRYFGLSADAVGDSVPELSS